MLASSWGRAHGFLSVDTLQVIAKNGRLLARPRASPLSVRGASNEMAQLFAAHVACERAGSLRTGEIQFDSDLSIIQADVDTRSDQQRQHDQDDPLHARTGVIRADDAAHPA